MGYDIATMDSVVAFALILLPCVESKSKNCILRDDGMYYKTLGGVMKCEPKFCPPFEKGHYDNCYCCNGPINKPINGGMSDWGMWNSESCEHGIQYRARTCTNPSPQHNGTLCTTKLGELSYVEVDERECVLKGVLLIPVVIFALCLTALIFMLIILSSALIYYYIKLRKNQSKPQGYDARDYKKLNYTVPGDSTDLIHDKKPTTNTAIDHDEGSSKCSEGDLTDLDFVVNSSPASKLESNHSVSGSTNNLNVGDDDNIDTAM